MMQDSQNKQNYYNTIGYVENNKIKQLTYIKNIPMKLNTIMFIMLIFATMAALITMFIFDDKQRPLSYTVEYLLILVPFILVALGWLYYVYKTDDKTEEQLKQYCQTQGIKYVSPRKPSLIDVIKGRNLVKEHSEHLKLLT